MARSPGVPGAFPKLLVNSETCISPRGTYTELRVGPGIEGIALPRDKVITNFSRSHNLYDIVTRNLNLLSSNSLVNSISGESSDSKPHLGLWGSSPEIAS